MSKTQWIGDETAFQRFRDAENRISRSENTGRAVNAVMFMDEMAQSPASDLFSAMREVIADRHVTGVGGFACVISNRDPGFRHSVYSDMLLNWPDGKGTDFILNLNDQIDFGASGENSEYAVAQISSGYLGLNIVGFYLLKPKKVFLFVGKRNGLPTECRILSDVSPVDIAKRLSESVGFDARWLLTIMAANPNRMTTAERWPRITEGPSGMGVSMFCYANTFPPTTSVTPS